MASCPVAARPEAAQAQDVTPPTNRANGWSALQGGAPAGSEQRRWHGRNRLAPEELSGERPVTRTRNQPANKEKSHDPGGRSVSAFTSRLLHGLSPEEAGHSSKTSPRPSATSRTPTPRSIEHVKVLESQGALSPAGASRATASGTRGGGGAGRIDAELGPGARGLGLKPHRGAQDRGPAGSRGVPARGAVARAGVLDEAQARRRPCGRTPR